MDGLPIFESVKAFLSRNSKGVSLEDFQQIALTFVVIGVLAGVGVLITSTMESDAIGSNRTNGNGSGNSGPTRTTSVSEALNNSTIGIGNITARLPLIGTVAGFIILLGFVIGIISRTHSQ